MEQPRGSAAIPILLMLAAVAGFGLVAFISYRVFSQPAETGPAVTIGWSEYVNDRYGFSFRYDPRYQVFEPNDAADERIVVLSPRPVAGQPVTAGTDELSVSLSTSMILDEIADRAEQGANESYRDRTVGGKLAKVSGERQGIEGKFQTILIDLDTVTLVIMASGQHLETLDAWLDTVTFSGSSFRNVNRPVNRNANGSLNRNANQNANLNINSSRNQNTNANVNSNANRNVNSNTNQPVSNANANQNVNTTVACTDDVRVCADGTILTRQPPTCAFPACPDGSVPTLEGV